MGDGTTWFQESVVSVSGSNVAPLRIVSEGILNIQQGTFQGTWVSCTTTICSGQYTSFTAQNGIKGNYQEPPSYYNTIQSPSSPIVPVVVPESAIYNSNDP